MTARLLLITMLLVGCAATDPSTADEADDTATSTHALETAGLKLIARQFGDGYALRQLDGTRLALDDRGRRVFTVDDAPLRDRMSFADLWYCAGTKCAPPDPVAYICSDTAPNASTCYCKGLVDCGALWWSGQCASWSPGPCSGCLMCSCKEPGICHGNAND